MPADLWKNRGEVTLRADGRVLDKGGTAIGTVRALLGGGDLPWAAIDDRHRIITGHRTSAEAMMAVHDRTRCTDVESASLYSQAAAHLRRVHALRVRVEQAQTLGEIREALEEIGQLDAEAERLAGGT